MTRSLQVASGSRISASREGLKSLVNFSPRENSASLIGLRFVVPFHEFSIVTGTERRVRVGLEFGQVGELDSNDT